MKKLMLILLLLNSLYLIKGEDYSTPIDGNLFIDSISPFIPKNMKFYNDDQILIDNNLVLNNDRIYEKRSNRVIIKIPHKTLFTDIAWINDESYVVLTGNSNRYPHGILGDKIESTGFEVYIKGQLASKYELENERVFETLRPLIADIIPENPGKEIILTSSDNNDGARVDVYTQDAVLIGQSTPIGRGYRWLHIIGVAQFNEPLKNYIAIVKTPHINGVLELLFWNGDYLESEVSLINNLSTHQIGSSNLNMTMLINTDRTNDSELIIPTFDFRNLLIIKYEKNELKVIKKFELPDRILTNLYFDDIKPTSIWFGLLNGTIVRIFE